MTTRRDVLSLALVPALPGINDYEIRIRDLGPYTGYEYRQGGVIVSDDDIPAYKCFFTGTRQVSHLGYCRDGRLHRMMAFDEQGNVTMDRLLA